MKYVIEKSSGEMLYAFEAADNVVIAEGGMVADRFSASDIRPETHEIISPPIPCPSKWGREYRWAGSKWLAGSARKGRIVERLTAIDAASIRPARAIAVGLGTDDDIARLDSLETEAAALRDELKTL
jgi:hypothetical protein